MNIQRGQDLAAADSSCPWERLGGAAKTRRKLREKAGEQRRKEAQREQSADTRAPVKWTPPVASGKKKIVQKKSFKEA